VEVAEGEDGRPLAVTLRGRSVEVTVVEDLWEIADEWWRPRPIARRYYAVSLQDGGHATIFRDLVEGGWYRQQL
jgi:hypothetical protein